jgi:hypothetical protein
MSLLSLVFHLETYIFDKVDFPVTKDRKT